LAGAAIKTFKHNSKYKKGLHEYNVLYYGYIF